MIIPSLDWNYWQLGFFGLTCLAWLVQLIYIFRYYYPIARVRIEEPSKTHVPVSVVISARNEEKNLMDHVPIIMDQDHPEFELIVVNDSSWDDTEAILKALEVRYPRMRVINLDEEKQNMQGKKFALTLAIKAAKYEHILLTDADCIPSSDQWIRQMTQSLSGEKEIAIGFSPYQRLSGWLNRMIRFDTLLIGLQYMGFAKRGNPYMGVGRNLAYKKDVFFRVGGFRNHYRLASGDDDLFVNQVAHTKNTVVVPQFEAQTTSAPKKTWADWFAQKRRHLTTAPYYKAGHKNLLALWPISFFLLFVGFTGSLVVHAGVWIVGGMLFARYVTHIAILHSACKKLKQPTDLVWMSPFLEVHLHVLNVGLYFSNLLRKPQKWS